MLTHFPPIKPYAEHHIKVDALHTIYVEECGNPRGLPVLFVHGGPGAGCSTTHRCFFDPAIYRIVLFDQRGCGRSTPHAELTNNNTQALVGDMEIIRQKLNIDRWVLFGGSWGSTLSLVYAQTHPDRVLGMILRGIFLARKTELEWFYKKGVSRIFPDYWDDFLRPIPRSERKNLIQAYYDRLTGDDDLVRMTAAKAWSLFEARCATLLPDPKLIEHFTEAHSAMSIARIECHYFVNDCFLTPGQIIKNMRQIRSIPAIIVHGRYDIICSLNNAWELHQKWKGSELQIIRDAGHSASEPGITDALLHATKKMALRVS